MMGFATVLDHSSHAIRVKSIFELPERITCQVVAYDSQQGSARLLDENTYQPGFDDATEAVGSSI